MDAEQFHRISKALADPRRFELLEKIFAGSEIACASLVEACEVTAPTVSHHIRELVTAGLIEHRKEAKYFFYRPRRDVLQSYTAELQARLRPARKS